MRQLHSMLKFASQMLPGIVTPQRAGPGQHDAFTIRIPENHPKADQLVRLFKFLETRVVMPSGIELKRPSPVQNPVGEFLSMLRDVVEDKESFDQALDTVMNGKRKDRLSALGLHMQQPQILASLLEAPLADGFMGDRVEHQETKKWALRAARKLRDRS
jgi:hypothetical protein